MNVNTNELVNFDGKSEEYKTDLIRKGFIPIPIELNNSAMRLLEENESVIVPLKSKSKLAKWAEKVRRNQSHAKK